MGTNFYHYSEEPDACPHCGRSDKYEKKHIGKSSGGWAFSLCVHPLDGINSLDDWIALWESGYILDEYGDLVTPAEMLARITQRNPGWKRHDIDGRFCLAHGPGTWDLLQGEFS
jgi:hypothetical protein